jgi:hypothetical protein
MSNILHQIGENLARVFRYILPGILILGGAQAAHPGWLAWARLDQPWHILALAVTALVAGNTWLAFHRYGVHQFVDMIFYCSGMDGPSARKAGPRAVVTYTDDLAHFVVRAFKVPPDSALRQHVVLRASAMHLMFIASEVAIVFSFFSAPGSYFERHTWPLRLLGLAGLLITLWQNTITRRIDWYSVEEVK